MCTRLLYNVLHKFSSSVILVIGGMGRKSLTSPVFSQFSLFSYLARCFCLFLMSSGTDFPSPLWSSGQTSWLPTQEVPGFDSRGCQIF
jgi:hypothetical protein